LETDMKWLRDTLFLPFNYFRDLQVQRDRIAEYLEREEADLEQMMNEWVSQFHPEEEE
jgi:predicted transcriptional regulator